MDVVCSIFPLQSHFLHEASAGSTLWEKAAQQGLHLISSDKNSCELSLLFQAAITHCARGSHVVFITHTQLQRLPLVVHGMPRPDPANMKHLKILYMSHLEEVVDYLAELHNGAGLHQELLVLHGLDHYIPPGTQDSRAHTMAKLLALLTDAQSFLQTKSDCGCQVLASFQDPHKLFQSVCHRYAQTIYKLKEKEGGLQALEQEESPLQVTMVTKDRLLITFEPTHDCVMLRQVDKIHISEHHPS